MAARNDHTVPESPAIATRSLTPLPDGRVPGADKSVWLWGSVPLGSLKDAKSDDHKERLGARLQQAIEELALLSATRAPNRQMGKSSYREVHILSLNVPVWYETPSHLPTKDLLDSYFRDELVLKRVVLFGVKLRPTTAFKGWRSVLDEVSMVLSGDTIPISDFDADADKVRRAFSRAELDVPDPADLRFADSWWNWSLERKTTRATPYVPHADHLHFLKTPAVRRALERVGEDVDCPRWPQELVDNPDQVAVTFGAVEGFELEYTDSLDPRSHWGMRLLDNNARGISVRALVEPSKITRAELRRMKRRLSEDQREFQKVGKESPYEADAHRDELEKLENHYSSGDASATLTGASVLVAFDGIVDDMLSLTPSGMTIDPMTNRQEAALHEMMLCSGVRANPHLLDLPGTTIAYSGISSLSTAGDQDGALAGFTETDRQPVWVTGAPQSTGDQLPIMEVAATTGSGKLLPLDAILRTPSGTVRMGDVQPGDELLGRGGVCRVESVSAVNPDPDLYRLSFSDGQHQDADADHQWVVVSPPEHRDRFAGYSTAARVLRDLAEGYPEQVPITAARVHALLVQALGTRLVPWATVDALEAVLHLLDIDVDEAAGCRVLRALEARCRHLAAERELLAADETVLTTAELLATPGRFSIRAADGLPGAHAELAQLLRHYGHQQVDGRDVTVTVPTAAEAQLLLSAARAAGKVARLDDTAVTWRAGDQRFEIRSIVPIDSRPGRCITVDSPDSTYLCADWLPTHNTQLLLWLAHQWHLLGHPQLLLDPKKSSDHSEFIKRFGGHTRKLDELEGSDGPLDPIRISTTPQAGIQLASDMLLQVNPWGDAAAAKSFETDIANALRYGVLERAATSTGQALEVAVKDGVLDDSIMGAIRKFVRSMPMFQPTYGQGSGDGSIELSEGMTLFMVGSAEFEMPTKESGVSIRDGSAVVKASANIIRMLLRAATAKLSGRSGIIHIDEAWMVELLAPGETEKLGRLARQMDVFPILYNQTPSTAVEAGVQNYVSRGFLGYLNSPDEAQAGLELFGMKGNSDIYDRVLTPRSDPGRTDGVNFNSLQHLYKPGGEREVIRGSVFYHSDLLGRIAATEITLPSEFLALTSTNPDDIRAREAAERVKAMTG
ncbi:MAG: hypothetical protein ACTH0V_00675 [Microbacteriaceae bacterium]